ncbi:MAG TPA: hypothetical protein VG273_21920 [Bryobacteraceae bacterium]|jgi:hypothetical protein|nr:hypothetical protein [Bryobacteraceae bacterium]
MNSAAVAVRSHAVLTVGGDEYRLVFDYDAIADAERVTGIDLLLYGPAAVIAGGNARQFTGLLQSAISPRVDIREVYGLMHPGQFAAIRQGLRSAWELSMPTPKKGQPRTSAPKLTNRELWRFFWSTAIFTLGWTMHSLGG